MRMTGFWRRKRWLIALAVLYVIFPRDLIPDYFGRGLGLIDDLALIAFLAYGYRKAARSASAGAAREGPEPRRREPPRRDPEPSGAFDPHAVLGVDPSATGEEIRAAYRARMREYHPDKVAHLGRELQELAHRKAVEIQRAYERLRA